MVFKEKQISLNKKIVLITLLIICLTSIPYIIGFQQADMDYKFSGFLFGVEDGNSYIGKMLLGSSGDWLFRSPYSSIKQNGVIAFLPYILLGKLAAGEGLHEQLLAIFQYFRISGIVFLVFVYLRFLKIFTKNENNNIFGLLILLLGSGWDWIFILLNNGRLPLSFYSPEAFGFLSIFGLPHLCFSRGFMLLGFSEILSTKDFGDSKIFIKCGIYFLISSLFQPLILVTAYIFFGIWWVINLLLKIFKFSPKIFFNQSLAILISLPFFLYYYFSTKYDPFMRLWTAQNILTSPPLIDYIVAYCPLVLLIIYLFFRSKQNLFVFFEKNQLILLLWFMVLIIIVYLPLSIQRRLIDGAWVAVVTLAIGLLELVSFGVVKKIILISFFISPLLFFIGSISSLLHPSVPQYQNMEDINIYNQLSLLTSANQVIFAPFKNSNEIPAFANLKVVTGHGPESIFKSEAENIFAELGEKRITTTELCKFIKDQQIDYFWLEPEKINYEYFQSVLNFNDSDLLINTKAVKIIKVHNCEP